MTITSQQRDTDADSVSRIAKWVPLAVILTGTFVFILDFFVVNVALPDIQRSLHASAAAIEWLVSGYALTSASLLVCGGRLGDHHGRGGGGGGWAGPAPGASGRGGPPP